MTPGRSRSHPLVELAGGTIAHASSSLMMMMPPVGVGPDGLVCVAVGPVVGGVWVGVGITAVSVGVGETSPPLTVITPLKQPAATAPPRRSLAPALVQASGYGSPASASSSISTVQVYMTTGQAGTGHSVVDSPQIGQTLSSARTKARMPVQSVPRVQPVGWKANDVAPLLMSGFTLHSGRPFESATIAAPRSKVMSFCVPAAPSVLTDTSKVTVPPAGPSALPIWMHVSPPGSGAARTPSVPVAGNATPAGSLAPSLLLLSGESSLGAPAATSTWHVYMTTGQAGTRHSSVDSPQIGQTLSRARTSARTAVHASPEQPGGWNANDVPPLLMSGFTSQSGRPLTFALILIVA